MSGKTAQAAPIDTSLCQMIWAVLFLMREVVFWGRARRVVAGRERRGGVQRPGQRLAVDKEISPEDVQRALGDTLGPSYRLRVTSGSSPKVRRNAVTWGTLHLSWSAGKTSSRVRPGGLILVAAFNAVYTVPKIRHALDRAFPQAR